LRCARIRLVIGRSRLPMRIFKHHVQLPIVLLMLLEAAMAVAGLQLASGLQLPVTIVESATTVLADDFIVFAGLMALAQAAMGLYNARLRAGHVGILLRMILAASAVLTFLWILQPFTPTLDVPLQRFALALALTVLGNFLLRLVYGRFLPADLFKRRVLVYGAGRQSKSISGLKRRSDRIGFRVVGYVRTAGDAAVDLNAPFIDASELLEYCANNEVDEIVVAMDDRRRSFPLHELLQCRLNGIDIIEVLSFLERETGRVYLDVLHPSWMIFSEGFKRSLWRDAVSAAMDLVAGVVLLAITWPLMLLTMITIKIEDGWRAPVLYRQRRTGRMGKEFDVLKFRSMDVDAESDGVARWAHREDPRVTWVGRLIRKLRIDELPQVFNILKGDMRFVGPRPERPEFVEELSQRIPYYRERHIITPGLTGWAQLCYPYGSSESDAIEKLQYDLYYIKNRSLLFDLAILVQTVEVILFGKGAR
jgi:sugar transferase (PEP-CTERM system associated)